MVTCGAHAGIVPKVGEILQRKADLTGKQVGGDRRSVRLCEGEIHAS